MEAGTAGLACRTVSSRVAGCLAERGRGGMPCRVDMGCNPPSCKLSKACVAPSLVPPPPRLSAPELRRRVLTLPASSYLGAFGSRSIHSTTALALPSAFLPSRLTPLSPPPLRYLRLKEHTHQFVNEGGHIGALDFRFPIGAPISGLQAFARTEQLGWGDKAANAVSARHVPSPLSSSPDPGCACAPHSSCVH